MEKIIKDYGYSNCYIVYIFISLIAISLVIVIFLFMLNTILGIFGLILLGIFFFKFFKFFKKTPLNNQIIVNEEEKYIKFPYYFSYRRINYNDIIGCGANKEGLYIIIKKSPFNNKVKLCPNYNDNTSSQMSSGFTRWLLSNLDNFPNIKESKTHFS